MIISSAIKNLNEHKFKLTLILTGENSHGESIQTKFVFGFFVASKQFFLSRGQDLGHSTTTSPEPC